MRDSCTAGGYLIRANQVHQRLVLQPQREIGAVVAGSGIRALAWWRAAVTERDSTDEMRAQITLTGVQAGTWWTPRSPRVSVAAAGWFRVIRRIWPGLDPLKIEMRTPGYQPWRVMVMLIRDLQH